jgi:uncharacterized Zn finger protein
MAVIPYIKQFDVRNWTDDVYFQRGQKYYEQGAIYDQRKQGMTLKSKCAGSQAPFYRQEVLFSSHGIESAECSCPVGEGGHCKHTVALLLTWASDPDSFKETESLDVVLEKRSKAELISLTKEMLEQEPDLESLLELPLVEGDSQPLNIKAIRQQANRAFQGTDFEWGYAREINWQNLQNSYPRRKRTGHYGILSLRAQILQKLGTRVASYWVFCMNKLLRMDNVILVVDDLKAAIAFFTELGLELEGDTSHWGNSSHPIFAGERQPFPQRTKG